MRTLVYTVMAAVVMLSIGIWQSIDAAPRNMSKQQAYRLLKAGDSQLVRALPAGEREILLAKMALDAGRTGEAVRLLSTSAVKNIPLAALIRAEAYRRQSIDAARRAGHYAHAVSGDIGKLQKARLNGALDEADRRLQAFMTGHAITQTAAARPVAVAASANTGLSDSVHQMLDRWARDWESRQSERYLAHYHPDFRTEKHDLASWSRYKRRVNGRKQYIRVQLSHVKIRRGPEQIAQGEAVLVTFSQRYQSSNYAANSRKQLYLVRKRPDDDWLILYEGNAGHLFSRPASVAKRQHQPAIHQAVSSQKAAGWAINIGAFDDIANAEHMMSRIHLRGAPQPFVSSISAHGKTSHRVRIGLYHDRDAAVASMVKLCPQLGLANCWLERVNK